MYTIKTPNKTIYTFILTFFHICVGTQNFFSKINVKKFGVCKKYHIFASVILKTIFLP